MKFEVGEYAILNENVRKDLPMHVGDLVKVLRKIKSNNFEYDVELANGDINPVREIEMNKLTKEQLQLVSYIHRGNKVIYNPTGEEVEIVRVDMLHGQVEVKFDKGMQVVGIEALKQLENEGELMVKNNYFEQKGLEVGQLVNKKQAAYGDSIGKAYKLMQTYLENYDNGDDTYTIPKSLLKHILLQIRIIDKQNRIFNNPEADLMGENPYLDTVGYGLLGMRMMDNVK